MNGNYLLEWTWFAVASAAVAIILGLYAVFAVVSLRRQLRELRRDHQCQNTSLLSLHGAMKVISEDVINHGQAQSSVRRTLERLSDQQSEMRLRDVGEGLYPQAIQLIQEGRGREEVRKLCALTQSEVDLLFSLHSQGMMPGKNNSGARKG